MTEIDRLFERLARIEALFAGATTEGERAAAGGALRRILARLHETSRRDPAIEYRFTFDNEWSRKLFVALLRRYEIAPYRYARQRYTTVMARVPASFVDETLWPEYVELNKALREHLDEVSLRIIGQAVSGDTSEPEVVRELPGGTVRQD